MNIITTRDQLTAFARQSGLRPDWHEPDEQRITARVEGASFDNAGFWPTDRAASHPSTVELHVIFSRIEDDGVYHDILGEDIAAVNLATLCAWAAGDGS